MTTELEAAISAARGAGRLLYERLGTTHQVRRKGPADLVTETDRQAEDLIVGVLLEACPDYGLLGEEGDRFPLRRLDERDRQWAAVASLSQASSLAPV